MTQGAEVARGGALRGAMLQTQAQTDRPMTQVEQCMHVLADNVGDLAMLMNRLREQLGPVLNPTGGANQTKPASAPTPVRSPVATMLDAQAERLAEIRFDLRDILDRLAV